MIKRQPGYTNARFKGQVKSMQNNCEPSTASSGWTRSALRILLLDSSHRSVCTDMFTTSQVIRPTASTIYGVLILFALSLWGSCATAQAMPFSILISIDASQTVSSGTGSYVEASTKGIASADSLKTKRQGAQTLSQWVMHHPNDVSADDIDALAGLLSDQDDAVRGWIAGALGRLGDKAKRAVPALQRALLERPCVHQALASAGAIRLSLSRIGVQPVNAPCTDPFGT